MIQEIFPFFNKEFSLVSICLFRWYCWNVKPRIPRKQHFSVQKELIESSSYVNLSQAVISFYSVNSMSFKTGSLELRFIDSNFHFSIIALNISNFLLCLCCLQLRFILITCQLLIFLVILFTFWDFFCFVNVKQNL